MKIRDEGLIVQYLLGRLPEEEKLRLEDRLLCEPQLLEQVEAIEAQLIRDALAGKLSEDQQTGFDEYFLSFPDLRRQHEDTKVLLELASTRQVTAAKRFRAGLKRLPRLSGNPWRIVAIAACIAACILAWRGTGPASRQEAGDLAMAFVLSPGGERGTARGTEPAKGIPNLLQIPDSAVKIRLQLDFEAKSSHSLYQVILSAVEADRQVWGQSGLPPVRSKASQSVSVEIPATVLGTGDYTVILNGLDNSTPERIETYSFGVTRPPAK
jgi:hypothetical protein